MLQEDGEMRATEKDELLEALPGPAWVVDCLLLKILASNKEAGPLGDDEFLARFEKPLDEGLIARLRGRERQFTFHAKLKGDSSHWLFSAARMDGELKGKRLILAQPAADFDVPTQLTFDEMLNSVFDGLVILNAARRIVQINQCFQQMFGYAIEELRGQTPSVLVPPESEHEFDASLDVLDRGGVHQLETKRRRRDGSLLEVQVSSRPIATGRFAGGLVVVYRDLTVTNRNARYRNLRLESTRILAQSVTLEEAVRGLLPAISQALDWDVTRLWMTGEGRMQCFHEYAKPGCSCSNIGKEGAECALSLEIARKGLVQRFDNFQPVGACASRADCKLRDGTQAVLPILDSQKQVLGVLEMLSSRRAQGATGRRELMEGICASLGQFIIRQRAELALAENEAKFRTLAETAPTAIFIHGDGLILYANAACETFSGYSRDELINHSVWRLFHPEEVETFKERSVRRLGGEDVEKHFEARVVRKNGEVRWADYSAARIMLDQRPAVLCAAIDVTERRELEAQLRQTQKMEAIGRLAGGIAHDFNNLLTVIGCCAEVIRMRDGLPDDIRRSTAEISHAAERAAALTRQLLSFSRHQVVAPKLIDLNSVLSGTELILQRSLGDDILLKINLKRGLGMILADASQVEQVVMNLAVNARDAMPDGGELSIRTDAVTLEGSGPHAEGSGGYLMLSVTDNGTGMSQEIQQHIFEPFFTTKQASKGTGLGLSTVYGIVKQCGGFIRVESEVDKGTHFEVYFPIAHEGSPEVKAKAPIQAESAPATILLVEDEEDVRSVLHASLLRDGHKILEASSADEALDINAAYEGKIDLLMTDVVMSGMSGRELADRLIPLRKGIKVLYVSGYNEDTVLQKGVIEGQMEFLQKPFSPTVLRNKVRHMLTTAKTGEPSAR
jgi:PAS domain S-box-containing protein